MSATVKVQRAILQFDKIWHVKAGFNVNEGC